MCVSFKRVPIPVLTNPGILYSMFLSTKKHKIVNMNLFSTDRITDGPLWGRANNGGKGHGPGVGELSADTGGGQPIQQHLITFDVIVCIVRP